jgi:hypothetical protein
VAVLVLAVTVAVQAPVEEPELAVGALAAVLAVAVPAAEELAAAQPFLTAPGITSSKTWAVQ